MGAPWVRVWMVPAGLGPGRLGVNPGASMARAGLGVASRAGPGARVRERTSSGMVFDAGGAAVARRFGKALRPSVGAPWLGVRRRREGVRTPAGLPSILGRIRAAGW